MKNSGTIKSLLSLTVLVAAISACTIVPIRDEQKIVIKDAPEWVNKGSLIEGGSAGHIFYGVASNSLQGDMALQKSIADDRSMVEISRILTSYLEAVSNAYLSSATRSGDHRGNEESVLRKIDEVALRQVNENVTSQIDDAITRQFKQTVTPQFKSEVSRQIIEVSRRKIKVAVANQVDFLRELEYVIAMQLKETVSLQIKKTTKINMAGARVVENWRDPTSNTIWTLSELDLKHVKNTISEINDMNVDLKNYFEIHAEGIFDNVIRERDNVNPFLRKR